MQFWLARLLYLLPPLAPNPPPLLIGPSRSRLLCLLCQLSWLTFVLHTCLSLLAALLVHLHLHRLRHHLRRLHLLTRLFIRFHCHSCFRCFFRLHHRDLHRLCHLGLCLPHPRLLCGPRLLHYPLTRLHQLRNLDLSCLRSCLCLRSRRCTPASLLNGRELTIQFLGSARRLRQLSFY